MANNKEKLFSDFPPISTQAWMDKIMADLKGADYEKKLVWRTNEGFKVKPFYRREDLEGLKTIEALPGEFPYLRGNKKNDNTWYVRQDIQVDNAEEANRKALDLLNRGIDSIGFVLRGSDVNEQTLHTLLKGIHPECIETNFSTSFKHAAELAELLNRYFKKQEYDPRRLHGSIDYDPLGHLMQKGKEPHEAIERTVKIIKHLSHYPHFSCIAVNSRQVNNAGAYIYQELGYALAWGNEYLYQLTEAGIPIDEVARKIKFNFGISSNYFMEIAKFRAARMLWADIVNEYHPADHRACQMAIHAETSRFNLTLFDAHVNLLRTQTEAMSAAIAGVDSITVLPFDSVYETPNDFSERIARNQQLLLKEESHLNRIVDPAAGSYYIEHLTDAIARQAWDLFLQTEGEGGMWEALRKGTVQAAVNASNRARHEALSKRREILLGTNQYPNFNEQAGNKVPLAPAYDTRNNEAPYPILNDTRAASEFEALRLQTEHSGKRPRAFMLTIGNLAMRQARAQFSCNFLACAGYEVIDNLGFPTIEAGVEAALKAQADIIVLCSSDDEYAQYAIPAYQAINGRALFIVAGAPACSDELKAAGIEHFIHVRCNVLETLKAFNSLLGIK